ncbi:MAG: protein O-mannosyl-transferase family [Vulcanimicrobiaceae bacterium]
MSRAARIAGWLAWAVPFAVYAVSLDRAVGYWDTGEMQVVPWILGIAHPTGFPVFTLLGWLFAHVVAIGPVSARMALFSAISMSLAAWLVSRIVNLLTEEPWVATASAWLFAFGTVAWSRGTRAEVHSLAACLAALTLYLALRWYRTADARALAGAGLAWGLGIATHPIVAMLLPALFVLLAARIRTVKPRAFALALVLLVTGVAFYAYLPLRSAYVTNARLDPTLELGVEPGKPFWDNDHPASRDGFLTVITGSEFNAGGTFSRLISPSLYRDAGPNYLRSLFDEFTPIGVLLAAAGCFALVRRDPWMGVALLLAGFVPSAFALGYSIEADPQRYYLVSFIVTAVFAGYGAAMAARYRPSLRFAGPVVVAALSVALLAINHGIFNQIHSAGARTVISTVQKRTPDNAILIAPWLYATPLAYGAYVDRSLGNRIVETAWLDDDAQRVPLWLRTRPVYVVGIVFGSVPGYHLQYIAGSPALYRVVKD